MQRDECPDLAPRAAFLGVGPRLDDSVRPLSRLIVQHFVHKTFTMGPSSAQSHQGRVDDNARQPRKKRRPALKRAQARICIAQGVLHCILCIFFVVQHSECNLIEPARVTGEKILLGIPIASDGLLNDHPFLAYGARGDTSVRIQRPCGG